MNKLIFTSLFFISFAYSYAQKFVNIGVENGLSAHQAYNIVEDANGFLWVSTKDGIDSINEKHGMGEASDRARIRT